MWKIPVCIEENSRLKSVLSQMIIVSSMIVMINNLQVLEASAKVKADRLPFDSPVEVQIGLKIEDMVEVNKQQESFTIVGALRMEWTDPNLSFDQEVCQCRVKVFTEDNFVQFQSEYKDRWPDFTFYNQHGDQSVQNRLVVIEPDGSALYFERFTTSFHTDFDFHRYPIDSQEFIIKLNLLYPEDVYYLKELPSFSGIDSELGQEEFILSNFNAQLSSIRNNLGVESSRYTVKFEGLRHLEYYIIRIFLPILGILSIAWAVFFLKDYHKRVELILANVVLFITFSFSLSENYPRLGYPTFLDAIMTLTLIINILLLLINVYMKVLENKGELDRADNIDRKLKWMYPTLLAITLLLIVVIFFAL